MSRKAILALVGAFIIVAAASVGVTAFVMSRGEDTTAVNQTPPTRDGGSGSGGTVSDSICGLEPGDSSSKPTTGATSAKWQQIGPWWLPVSAISGPIKRSEAGPWSCFSHDQSGATLAAYTIALRATGVAENWQEVVRQQTMPGPSQDARLAAGLPAVTDPTSPKGFQIAAYSEDQATLRYYLHSQRFDLSCTMDVAWSNGDWKLQLGSDGSTSSGCTQGAPTDFIPWGP